MNTSNDHVRESLVMVREELERMRLAYLKEARTSDESSMVNYYMAQSNAFYEAVVILDAAIVQAEIEDDERKARANEWPDDVTIRHRDRLRAQDFGVVLGDDHTEKPDAVSRMIFGALVLAALVTLAGVLCFACWGAALAAKAMQ